SFFKPKKLLKHSSMDIKNPYRAALGGLFHRIHLPYGLYVYKTPRTGSRYPDNQTHSYGPIYKRSWAPYTPERGTRLPAKKAYRNANDTRWDENDTDCSGRQNSGFR